jgi:hypothetical protein
VKVCLDVTKGFSLRRGWSRKKKSLTTQKKQAQQKKNRKQKQPEDATKGE